MVYIVNEYSHFRTQMVGLQMFNNCNTVTENAIPALPSEKSNIRYEY